jgi:hypothetical protein
VEIHEVGTLKKGDPCVVDFPDGRASWLCRVAASLAYDDNLKSMYECITPHGSVVVTGAVWVRPMTDSERKTLSEVEQSAQQKGLTLYKGRVRVTEEK